MGGTILAAAIKEKNLAVTSTDTKVSSQSGIAASKGNKILGLIRRNIAYNFRKKS